MSETMTNADSFWFNMDEPTNLMVITAFMTFDAPVDFKRLQATIEHRLSVFPRFRKRVLRPASGVGPPRWEFDPNYDVRSQVHRIGLPHPGDKAALQELVGTLMATPLDASKPLWEVHLIDNFGAGCVILFRIHHCIADGMALIHVMLAAADKHPDAPWPEPDAKATAAPPRRSPFLSMRSLTDGVNGLLDGGRRLAKRMATESRKVLADPTHALTMAKSASELAADVATVLGRLTVLPPDPHTPFKGRLGTRKRAVWTEPMPLEDIKAVGRAIQETTVNDVLIAAVTGAMRRYLKSRSTRVNELDLRVMVPVNVRRPGTEFELGNKFSTVVLQLPVYIEDPILRLREVHRRMDKIKNSPEPYVNFGTLQALGLMPPTLSKQAAHFFASKASGVLTNVPGPKEPLYFAGCRIENIMFWVPRSANLGLGISILSYAGQVTLGIAADEKLMPDPEKFLQGFEDEFADLLERVRTGRIDEAPLVLHDRYREGRDARRAEAPDATGDKRDSRCRANTQRGSRCKKRALPGERYCATHAGMEMPGQDADQSREAADDRVQAITELLDELVE
jgi:WS/DGAT/MGAT family acyltransferase